MALFDPHRSAVNCYRLVSLAPRAYRTVRGWATEETPPSARLSPRTSGDRSLGPLLFYSRYAEMSLKIFAHDH
jgi:hypothetical protein